MFERILVVEEVFVGHRGALYSRGGRSGSGTFIGTIEGYIRYTTSHVPGEVMVGSFGCWGVLWCSNSSGSEGGS